MAPTLYRPTIETAVKPYGLDPDLLEALVLTESSGRADAFRFEPGFYQRYLAGKPEWQGQIPRRISSSYGLCQIMYPTARQYGFRNEPEMLFLPGVNLDLGARILQSHLVHYTGNIEKALQAYNGGRGNVGSPATQVYSAKVFANLETVRAARG